QTQGAGNPDVTRTAIRTDDHPEHTGSLILRLAGFLGILGIGRKNRARSRNPSAYVEYAATCATALAGAEPRTGTTAHTAARARTNAAAKASAIRRWPGQT